MGFKPAVIFNTWLQSQQIGGGNFADTSSRTNLASRLNQ
jgi:hypothetical protein